jgi:ATP-dependent exoDNAse (exonuclease V) beta subunit
MTRARDHLVVCLHHKQRNGIPDASLAALVTGICADNRSLWRALPDGAATNGRAPAATDAGDGDRHRSTGPAAHGGGAPETVALPERWETDRLRLLASLRRRPVTTATAVAGAVVEDPGWPCPPGVEKKEPDVARRVGRAVHVALADIDLTTGADAVGTPADEVAQSAARAEGVSGHGSEVAAMVRAALTSPTVAPRWWRRHWREVPVTVPVGLGGLLEGVVDLLLEDDDGLVVVDYKTDRIEGVRGLSDAVAAYRLQVAAYALALESSTGRRVQRCVLVFVGADEPCEHVLEGEDLAVARDEARRLAEALVVT